MEIVLGVSMTPTTVRMVLVEGNKADGLTVDHDVFDVTGGDGAANSRAPEQVISAVLGTQQSALQSAHKLVATGVTWRDHDDATALRDGLAAHGIEDVMLVSELHAAGALAQAVGRAVGYAKTALMFVEADSATLAVVETHGGSIVKVVSESLHAGDALAVLGGMVAGLETQDPRPEGIFVVGSGVDVTSVKQHLELAVSLPVSAPEDADLALARGAALAAASAPRFEASTVGLAYSQDPDGSTAGDLYVNPAAAETQLAPAPVVEMTDFPDVEPVAAQNEEGRKPFLLVGSSLTAVFVIGVVALVISLAVSIRPTADQRPDPGESAVIPNTVQAAPPVEPEVPQVAPAPPAPPPQTIPPPIPVVQQAPRPVVVQQQPQRAPIPQAPAPPPAAPAPPPPAALPPAPPPVAPVPAVPPPVVGGPVFIPPILGIPFPNPGYRPPTYIPPQRPNWPQWPQRPPQPPQTVPQYPPSQPQIPGFPPAPQQPQIPQQPQYPPQQPQIPQQPPAPQQPQIPILPQLPIQLPIQLPLPGLNSSDSGSGRRGDSGGGRRGDSGGRGGSPFCPIPGGCS